MDLLFIGILLGMALVCLIAAICCGPDRGGQKAPGNKKLEGILRMHEDTISRIDQTADYYVRLFRYIAERVDDETRQRQSS